jgi:hypothetical protein
LQGKYLGGKQKKKKQVDLPFGITASLFREARSCNKNTYKYNLKPSIKKEKNLAYFWPFLNKNLAC